MSSQAKEFVIGGLSGMSASAVTHPIDLIKVRMLLHGEMQQNQRARLTIARQVVAREGVRGLYSGLTAALVRQSLYSTTRFGFYDFVKRLLGERKSSPLPYYRKVIATMVGGALGSLVACPADLMLVRMQADGRLPFEQQRRYRNVVHGLMCVARDEGLGAWYRGVGPLVVRGVLVTTAQFSTYDQAKETLMTKFAFTDSKPAHFLSSALAGMVAAVVSTPCDVIKSRMMNSTKAGQHGNPGIVYNSSFHCLAMTLRTEGVPGLFKGFVPCLVRMMPQVILLWNFYESYKSIWTFLEVKAAVRVM